MLLNAGMTNVNELQYINIGMANAKPPGHNSVSTTETAQTQKANMQIQCQYN